MCYCYYIFIIYLGTIMSHHAPVFEFLDIHINTKRASTSKPIKIKQTGIKEDDLDVVAEYQLNFEFQYINARHQPTSIKIGMKDHKACIRIDERLRSDRERIKDYFAEDLDSMKDLVRHLCRIIKDYERTQYFLRAQLIPGLFNQAKQIMISQESKYFNGQFAA